MGEDPEAAQARVFLAELDFYADRLVRRRSQWGDDQPSQAIEAELAQVRQQIHKLHERFPDLPPGAITTLDC
ncbi:hypothetical protein KHQ06_26865 [Nocardia tengchongensis]|uniref:Uncharacterized protein n=1 Tax=Nocardia tengchongensis TaxID=2055889 RepID=A0ABX8CNY0_9NOCA|nr:hypothetical protein [Nocardia tengchongensis]QVI19900.1 hypothetical protein KHQ06_26865 [Nocardia tengchongensis]